MIETTLSNYCVTVSNSQVETKVEQVVAEWTGGRILGSDI